MQKAGLLLAPLLFVSPHLPLQKEFQMKKSYLYQRRELIGKWLKFLKKILTLALLVLEILKKIRDF